MTVKLRRLECLCEVVAANYNISHAAERLCTSQPTVSRQLQLLEEDLGFQVLIRAGNAIRGLTREGEAAFQRAQRIVHESRQLRRLREEFHGDGKDRLTIATTHFHARYTLLDSVKALRAHYPKISFSIFSGTPAQIREAVLMGRADIGVYADKGDSDSELVAWPCFEIRRVVITPPRHPLLRASRPSLELIARYPLITYDQSVSAGWRILDAFTARKLAPEIVLSAAGAEVIKAYVGAGVGIAIIQERAFDKAKDRGIRAKPADHLFAPVTAVATVRRGTLLTRYMRELLTSMAPHLAGVDLDRDCAR